MASVEHARASWGLEAVADTALDVWVSFRTGSRNSGPSVLYVDSLDPTGRGTVMAREALPPKKSGVVRFVVISDTHGRHRQVGALLWYRSNCSPYLQQQTKAIADTPKLTRPRCDRPNPTPRVCGRALGRLPEGDIMVHCGDILMSSWLWSSRGRVRKYQEFNSWLNSQNVNHIPHRVVIAGLSVFTQSKLLCMPLSRFLTCV